MFRVMQTDVYQLIEELRAQNDASHERIIKAVNGGARSTVREVRWDSIIVILLISIMSYVYLDNLNEARETDDKISQKLENVTLIQREVITTQRIMQRDLERLRPAYPRFGKKEHEDAHSYQEPD
jgi:hypothetical protein